MEYWTFLWWFLFVSAWDRQTSLFVSIRCWSIDLRRCLFAFSKQYLRWNCCITVRIWKMLYGINISRVWKKIHSLFIWTAVTRVWDASANTYTANCFCYTRAACHLSVALSWTKTSVRNDCCQSWQPAVLISLPSLLWYSPMLRNLYIPNFASCPPEQILILLG